MSSLMSAPNRLDLSPLEAAHIDVVGDKSETQACFDVFATFLARTGREQGMLQSKREHEALRLDYKYPFPLCSGSI